MFFLSGSGLFLLYKESMYNRTAKGAYDSAREKEKGTVPWVES